ncbi:sigma-70 family RNA polymerase sigma factor [Acaryochloris sp. CCMEE 5410]|uniref:sigma-70 family RNA polymerase sigma factor n=1 Tax=Acaryochloris sp. CCMEE 5410 TaxID=310037 RepID=UPI0002483FC8|nr:sigma-70 family RNA polymerase sigma factor [Acaryochloris sp. CCMEE 5410]KAI9129345.1 sigma-70 family RNA polymerase sigma factor [Acaryochloris sp. CCMEE 5410]
MVQIVFSQDSYSKRPLHEGLTEQQAWELASQVKARTQLLKHKKEGLTLAEKRICLRGERALRLLINECRPIIWAQIYRFIGSERISRDEMYQLGVMCVERAANNHNPNKPGRQRKFKSWVSFQLRQRFLNLFRGEFRFCRRNRNTCNQLIHTNRNSDGYTPLDSALNKDLRERLDQIITTSLTEQKAKLLQAYYWQDRDSASIASHFGIKRETVKGYLYESRKQLRENPQLKELAESVFSATPNY